MGELKIKIKIISLISILLFLGLSFSPSIIAEVKKPSLQREFVQLDVEFCGLGKKYNVKITPSEYKEFKLLFDNFLKRLSDVKSDDEAVSIFNKAIEDFDRFGLLGGISVKFAQRLITKQFEKIRENKIIKILSDFNYPAERKNLFCLVAGESNNTHFFSLPIALLIYINYISNDKILSRFTLLFYLYMMVIAPGTKYRLLTYVTFGRNYEYMDKWYFESSYGNIWTRGLGGNKECNTPFIGDFILEIPLGVPWNNNYYIGAQGFIGIQATVDGFTSFLGISPRVKIRKV